MSKNFLQKVIVTLVTVALLCTAFALTTFAALSIENGVLTGKDEGTYTAKQVTAINPTGDGLTYSSTVVTLDGTESLAAGLWQVTCPDSTTVILYSEGSAATRQQLGIIASGTKFKVNDAKVVGKFASGIWTSPKNNNVSASQSNLLFNYSDGNYGLRSTAAATHLASSDGQKHLGILCDAQNAYKADPSDANAAAVLAAQTSIINKFNTTYYTQYAYTPDEMIPANEVLSFTYKMGFYSSYTYFKYTGDDVYTKVILYVTDNKGTVSQHPFTVKRLDGFLSNSSKNNTQKVTIDFTVADDNGAYLTADKFVVGMQVHPYIGMEKGKTEIGTAYAPFTSYGTTSSTKRNWGVVFYPGDPWPSGYVIALPKVSAPTAADFTITDGVVTVNTTDSYKYAPADAEGNYDDADLVAVESGVTTLTAGYWAFIKVSTDANYVDSDAYIVDLSIAAPVVTANGLTVTIPKDNVGTVYQYSKVAGLNAAGTAVTKSAYTDMTLAGDVYTATLTTGGLYYFKGVSSLGNTNEVLVYVEGPAIERKNLGQATSTGVLTLENNANFYIGEWGGSSYTWNNCDTGYNLRPTGASANSYGWHLAHLGTRGSEAQEGRLDYLYTAQEAYKADPTPDNLTALQTAANRVLGRLTTIYAHYAYMPEEFIPADEVNSFTYKVKYYHTYDNFAYAGTDVQTKMILYVFNSETGKVETYTWTKDHTQPVIGYNNKNQVSVTFDFTTAADNGNFLSSVNGYVVGMRFYPYVGFEAGETDPTLVTVEDGSHQWLYSLTVDPAGYNIDVPKISAPTAADFTITNNIVTVNTSYSYKYAPADADGNYDVADLEAVVSGETVLTGGYWAFVKVSNDANFLDSDAFILTHVSKATTPTISIDRNGYFALDTTAEGYNEEYEYEFHMVTEDTDLENLDANTWTTFNPANFQVQEAGETYLVRVKAGEAWTASDAVETKSPKAILTGISLVLDGQIGIKFTVDAKTAKVNVGVGGQTSGDPYMRMYVSGGTYRCTNKTNENWIYFNNCPTSAAGATGTFKYDTETGRTYSILYVGAKDYATTTVTFPNSYWRPSSGDAKKEAWPSGSYPNWGSTTVKTYIDLYKQYAESDPATYGECLPLVLALEEYCMNAANYFDDEAEALDAVEADDADIANAPLKSKDGTLPEGIEFYGTSLMLEDRTQIRYYFRVDSSLYTVDGETFTWNEDVVLPNADKVKTTKLISNGVIFYESSPISAHQLGDPVTETFTTADTSYTVVYSPLNYIAETYSSTNAKTANLAKALYNYYKAADAYVK